MAEVMKPYKISQWLYLNIAWNLGRQGKISIKGDLSP
jgi:hypothetical protein